MQKHDNHLWSTKMDLGVILIVVFVKMPKSRCKLRQLFLYTCTLHTVANTTDVMWMALDISNVRKLRQWCESYRFRLFCEDSDTKLNRVLFLSTLKIRPVNSLLSQYLKSIGPRERIHACWDRFDAALDPFLHTRTSRGLYHIEIAPGRTAGVPLPQAEDCIPWGEEQEALWSGNLLWASHYDPQVCCARRPGRRLPRVCMRNPLRRRISPN